MAASSDLFSPLSAGPLSVQAAPTPGTSLGGFFKPDALPAQFGQATAEVPDLTRTADVLKGFGSTLTGQGADALAMAARGELTAPQQAQLDQFRTGLTNQARQMYYSMGRTPDQDTSFLGTTADIDAKVNAMAQQEIQTTIQLGLGELTSGSSFFGQSLGFDQTAVNTLISAGQAQLKQDEEYRKTLSDTFSSIFKLVGTVGGAFVGGPGGAAVGGMLGGLIGGKIDQSQAGGSSSALGGAEALAGAA